MREDTHAKMIRFFFRSGAGLLSRIIRLPFFVAYTTYMYIAGHTFIVVLRGR